MKKLLRSLCAVLLSAVLLCPPLLPCAGAESETVFLRTPEDWTAFVQSCRLDAWSQGKTVRLENDLDLSGLESVPTFGGTFDGGGHTIKGLSCTQEGSHQGLFRYVQEGAGIVNLTVTGTVAPAGTSRAVGGIAGVNRGTIARCRFDGTVIGTDGVGGIAGINEASGQLVNCTSAGAVSGEHYTGGISGENYGSIVRCTNEARVNTQEAEVSPELDALELGQLNNAENIPACTDTGGIAGYSKGTVQGCTNRGTVGYPHTGYNVGGIVGRQSGIVDGCVNRGSIQGRKDVGGVAGQMEPYIMLQFEEDSLQKLEGELDTLSTLLDRTLNSTQASGNALADHIDRINELADLARNDVSGMADHLENWGSGTVDTANDLSARISRTLDQSIPVAEDLEEAMDRLSQGVREVERALETLETADQDGDILSIQVRFALGALEKAMDNLHTAQSRVTQALRLLPDSLGSDRELEEAMEQLRLAWRELGIAYASAAQSLEDLELALPDGEAVQREIQNLKTLFQRFGEVFTILAGNHFGELEETLTLLQDALGELSGSGDQVQAALRRLQDAVLSLDRIRDTVLDSSGELRQAFDTLAGGTDAMTSAFGTLKNILETLAEEPDLVFPDLDSGFYEQEDRLNSTLSGLNEAVNAMNRTARRSGDSITGSLREVNQQLRTVAGVLQEAWREPEEREDYIVDTSAELETTWGQVTGCSSFGSVEGDVNVGGIAGAMAVEYDFDPEDDVTSQGSSSTRFQYRTSAVILESVNYGPVTARKNNVGGVVGVMDLGLVRRCGSTGSVESTGGQYVGGVAGSSYAAIQGSWAKCTLTGERYVGGVAGLGTDIVQCRTLVELRDGLSSLGAVAGALQEDGALSQNLFVSQTLGGVDGVSYAGKAEPVDYDGFLALEKLPAPFQTFTLTFQAGEEIVEQRSFSYGDRLDVGRLPPVPEREGFYGSWALPEEDTLLFDTVIEARYTPWLTAIASPDGAVLAEGRFGPEAALSAQALGEGHWQVSLSEGSFTALRLSTPEGIRRPAVWTSLDGESWQKAAWSRDGSYLRVELAGQTAQVRVEEQPLNLLPGLGLAGAAAGGSVLLLRRRKKRTKKAKAAAGNAS